MKTRLDLPQLLTDRGLIGEGAEIGIMFGEFSRHVLENWPGRLYMIDPWKNQEPSVYLDGCNSLDMEKAMTKAKASVKQFGDRAVIMRAYSTDAVKCFEDGQLSFAYLDGNHSFDAVTADLNAYWPKLRSGAVMVGHDFYERHDDWHDCGVECAVREFAMQRLLKLNIIDEEVRGWWIDKP